MSPRGPDTLSPAIAHLTAAAPLQAGVLATAVRDLALAIDWAELRPMALPGTEWVAVVGRKRLSDPLRAVLPLPLLTTSLTPGELKAIFASLATVTYESLPAPLPPLAPTLDALRALKAEAKAARAAAAGEEVEAEEEQKDDDTQPETALAEFDPDTLYLAIGTTDSTCVYYKLARGVRKPHDIPDE